VASPNSSQAPEVSRLFNAGGRTKNYTRGGTTSESRDKEQDNFRVNALGVTVNIVPKPLFVIRKSEKVADKDPAVKGKRVF
jgi:hypothetical protein